jgi:cobalamin biosynthesis protein CobC
MREHGGNLDQAVQRFGGCVQDWIDLSTGINRQPYPVGEIGQRHWSALPSHSDIESLHEAARQAYATGAPILALAGAQAAIQLLPRLEPRGRARVLAPTYNEYAAVLSAAGWDAAEVSSLGALAGADLAVVVNPNNPDAMTRLSCSRCCRASVVLSSTKVLLTPRPNCRWQWRRDDQVS